MRYAVVGMAMVLGAVVAGQGGETKAEAKVYRDRMTAWRASQEKELKTDEGWLSVAGLYWLQEGENSIGTDAASKLVLPPKTAPAKVGVLNLTQGHVTFTAAEGAMATLNARPVATQVLKLDSDRVQVAKLTFMAIQRGKRIGVRLFNPESNNRKKFKGMQWFPVDESMRITAKFVPYDPPRTIAITNVLGDTSAVPRPGFVTFVIGGKECRLEAQASGAGLFFNFHDLTSGRETYPAGRFLDAPAPKDGVVELDFNQAVNPPCAFTEFATCPLPPHENFLNVAINAGEKTHHPH